MSHIIRIFTEFNEIQCSYFGSRLVVSLESMYAIKSKQTNLIRDRSFSATKIKETRENILTS